MHRTCSICRQELTLKDFRMVNKTTRQRDCRCNRCFNNRRRQLTRAKQSKSRRKLFADVKDAKSHHPLAELAAATAFGLSKTLFQPVNFLDFLGLEAAAPGRLIASLGSLHY